MQLKPLVAASLVAFASLGAQAATTNWGSHDLLESALGGTSGGVIYDTYAFTLGTASTVASSVSTFGSPIAPANYSIWNADNTATPFSWNFGGAPTVHTVNLAAGSYYYAVFGVAPGFAAYSINSAAVATPVPEPETYAMLLAGLGIVGFVARRRRAD
jgi:hypothetical protein